MTIANNILQLEKKLESILSHFNECKFLLQEDDNIHNSLNNKVLDICRSNFKKENVYIALKDSSNINVKKKKVT